MNNNYPTVTIGCPVRNRAVYLPHYLNCIKNLEYPKKNITLLFVENDSKDSTLQILNQFKKENSQYYHKIKIEVYNQNTPEDARKDVIRKQYTYNALAKLRNFWLSQIKTDFALSCDSDIMMPKDTLIKLLSHKKDYVAGLIINGYLYNPSCPEKYTNILQWNGYAYVHIGKYPENSLIPVDFSGAIMLLSQKACKLGKFGYADQGEDQIFCESLRKQNIELFCDTSVKCTHCMNEEYLNKFIKDGFFF